MKTRTAVLGAAMALLASLATLAQQTLTVTGTAAILNGDMAQARDRAVESALRTAVEQVVGTMVDSESLVKNNELLSDKIYTQTRGYISSYKILKERPDTDSNIYTVNVEATVKEGNLQDDLGSLGLLMRRMQMPRVCVAINEPGWAASSQLARMLKDKGFIVVDTGERFHNEQFTREFWGMSQPQQADLLKKYGAEVVILGSAVAGQAGQVGKSAALTSYRADVALKALKTDTQEMLGSSSASRPSVQSLDEAIKEATTMAGSDLIRQITKQWSQEASSTRMLTLEVKGLSAGDVDRLAGRLRTEGRGVQDVIVRDASPGSATLSVSMQGDAAALAQEVLKVSPKLRVLSQSANRLTVSR
jgi:hypothetical protein